MISKEKIKKSVVCYWSAEDEMFIADSAMIPHVVIGVGDSADEAISAFATSLDNVYDEIASNNLAGYKMGRPAKGYVPFNANVRPSSKERISELAREMEISQGEAFDYLVFFHECKLQERGCLPERDELVKAFQQFTDQQSRIVREQEKTNEKLDRIAEKSEAEKRLFAQAASILRNTQESLVGSNTGRFNLTTVMRNQNSSAQDWSKLPPGAVAVAAQSEFTMMTREMERVV